MITLLFYHFLRVVLPVNGLQLKSRQLKNVPFVCRLNIGDLASKSWTFHTTSLTKFHHYCRALHHSLNVSTFHTTDWQGSARWTAIHHAWGCSISRTTGLRWWTWQKTATVPRQPWRLLCQYQHRHCSVVHRVIAAVRSHWKSLFITCLTSCCLSCSHTGCLIKLACNFDYDCYFMFCLLCMIFAETKESCKDWNSRIHYIIDQAGVKHCFRYVSKICHF